jgi:hypothetical protein
MWTFEHAGELNVDATRIGVAATPRAATSPPPTCLRARGE